MSQKKVPAIIKVKTNKKKLSKSEGKAPKK